MNTKKLFSEDAYRKECDATVVEVRDIPAEFLPEGEIGKNRIVVLDQTVFYSLSGGQPGDTGTINDERVVDTRYQSDKKLVIYHYLETPTDLKAGDTVHCKIDWDRRYHHMRVHSLIHIMMSIFEEMYGKQPVIGSNMSEKGRFDIQFFDETDMDTLQKRTQEMIDEGHDIETVGEPGNEVKRIWKMPPLPDQGCGGTHPKNSKEVGKIRLKRKSLSSQGQRIYCMLEDKSFYNA